MDSILLFFIRALLNGFSIQQGRIYPVKQASCKTGEVGKAFHGLDKRLWQSGLSLMLNEMVL
jgi:hypothetical protein